MQSQFPFNDNLPLLPLGIAQPDPNEMEEFVSKNPAELSALPEQLSIHHNDPLAQKRTSVYRLAARLIGVKQASGRS